MKRGRRGRNAELRQRAEARVRSKKQPSRLQARSPEQVAEVVHELRVYQVELELQNDELQRVQTELEGSFRSLALSEERYRTLYETAPVAHLTLDPEGCISGANPAAEALLRSNVRLLVGRRLSDFVAPAYQDDWHRLRRALAVDMAPGVLSLDLCVGNEAVAHVELAASPLPDLHPPSGLSIALFDVTERRRAERQVRESERRVRLLTDSLPLLVSFVDRDERYVFANPAYETWFGAPLSEIKGHTVREVLGDDAYAVLAPRIADALAGRGASFEAEVPYKRTGMRYVSATYSPDISEDGSVRGFYSTVLDLTALIQTKRALRASAAEVVVAEHRERRKLAEDLHDDVAQLLSLASITLRALADAPDARERGRLLERATSLVTDARKRVSSLSFQLSPPILHDVGLVAAAEWLAEDLHRSYGIEVEVYAPTELTELDDSTRITLFRALRELLINVARHARSGKAHVRIARDGAVAEITVEDEGVGFDPAEIQGFGLRNLHDRLEHLGGEVAVDSAPGRGTRVRVRAPIHGNEPGAPQAPEREVDHDGPRASGR